MTLSVTLQEYKVHENEKKQYNVLEQQLSTIAIHTAFKCWSSLLLFYVSTDVSVALTTGSSICRNAVEFGVS